MCDCDTIRYRGESAKQPLTPELVSDTTGEVEVEKYGHQDAGWIRKWVGAQRENKATGILTATACYAEYQQATQVDDEQLCLLLCVWLYSPDQLLSTAGEILRKTETTEGHGIIAFRDRRQDRWEGEEAATENNWRSVGEKVEEDIFRMIRIIFDTSNRVVLYGNHRVNPR